MKKYFSHSEYYLWHKDKQKYYERYVLGIEEPKTPAMELGTLIHKCVEEPRYPWLQELRAKGYSYSEIEPIRKLMTKIKRPPESEVVMTVDGLIGIFDGLDKQKKILYEFKTSRRDWTQFQVDTNSQLSFYAYIWKKIFHGHFSDIVLYSLNTERGTIKTFRTNRGPADIKDIERRIKKTIKEIQAEGWWEKRLSRDDKNNQQNLMLF
jgi:hypothetical protein